MLLFILTAIVVIAKETKDIKLNIQVASCKFEPHSLLSLDCCALVLWQEMPFPNSPV